MKKLSLFALVALVLLPGCPRETVDRCSGDDPHPECDNNVPGDGGNNVTGDAGDMSNNVPGDMADMTVPPDLGPCGMVCADPTPFCDAGSGTCVACLGNEDCPDGVCADDNTCVSCLADTDCTDQVCDNATNTCVDCVANDDCTDPTASFCDTASNTCTACTASADCGHLADTTICDTSGTAGVCVECLDDDDTTRAACMGNSCDPATNTCTQTPTESVGVCEACIADSECGVEHRCVPMQFDAQQHGSYCLKTAVGGCSSPYVIALNQVSLSGAAAEDYCGIRTDRATCESILSTGVVCADASECGAMGVMDGVCSAIDLSGNDKCTARCVSDDDCPLMLNCTGNDVEGAYCE